MTPKDPEFQRLVIGKVERASALRARLAFGGKPYPADIGQLVNNVCFVGNPYGFLKSAKSLFFYKCLIINRLGKFYEAWHRMC